VKLVIRPEAEQDLANASNWHSRHGVRLKQRFVARIEATLDRIRLKPEQFPYAKGPLRRASVREFPYSIYYRVEESEIIIFAVLHHSRDLAVLGGRLN
jgi:plasmid stabilization system protein ParE